jgi:hypothetical protein
MGSAVGLPPAGRVNRHPRAFPQPSDSRYGRGPHGRCRRAAVLTAVTHGVNAEEEDMTGDDE